ncbi:Synaptojanin-1 [Orbilia brochopaga]|nr:Synaptojanin-1 [Drechslerella brochopaga]
MPGLIRKVLIFAAIDGLLLLPAGPRSRSQGQTKIAYKTAAVNAATTETSISQAVASGSSFEAVGIAGILSVPSGSWLIAITKRSPVAEIKGRQIFVITDIALIPLNSKSDAEAAIARVRAKFAKRNPNGTAVEDSESDDEYDGESLLSSDDDVNDDPPRQPSHNRTKSSIAEDVIGKKGLYGRFAERWFSKRGWQVDKNRLQGLSGKGELGTEEIRMKRMRSPNGTPSNAGTPTEEATEQAVTPSLDAQAQVAQGELTETGGDPAVQAAPESEEPALEVVDDEVVEGVANSLTPKLLRTTKILLSASRSFYFSYDYDITRSIAKQTPHTSSDVPLHKKVDREFFWNRHLLDPFTEAGQHHLALPLMQGFVAQQNFQIPNQEGYGRNFLLTLISRRSVKRAGLRYLRRGVNESGNVANCVETEQLLSDIDKNAEYSFVQMRGSIPIFFQQSPYALKPKPILMHNEIVNKAAFQSHFRRMKDRYGEVQVVNLVERHSLEGIVGDKYEKYAQELEDPKIRFEWFDFHSECRGMKFENVSRLLDRVGGVVEEFGWTEEKDDKIEKTQTGVIRTNCMDCLDRTNVVMSNFARRALETQLTRLSIDPTRLDKSLNFMNLIWADNGDAISKQYSSTAALKGDFTRTKKRNISGALADFGLTLTRFWNNIIGDFFTQAVIDYLLGNVSAQVFVEFEAKMMSGDPAVSVSKVRQNAIETSCRLVIADSNEEMIGGWSLLTPNEENTLRTFPFKEVVLLLTDAALYFCKFDFAMDKVSAFERIALENIKGLQYGAYITSTLTSAQVDEKQNVGLVIKYESGKDDILRINTRSLTANVSRESSDIAAEAAVPPSGDEDKDVSQGDTKPPPDPNTVATDAAAAPQDDGYGDRILAFKAISADATIKAASRLPSPIRRSAESEEETLILSICNEIERACKTVDPSLGGTVQESTEEGGSTSEQTFSPFIEKKDVVSVLEAKKSTGLLEQVGYSIRRWVWA